MDSIYRTYTPDPARVKHILHVGDTVICRGKKAVVVQINITENTMLDGIEVPAVPWMAVSLFTATLDNGMWAYGEQLKPNR